MDFGKSKIPLLGSISDQYEHRKIGGTGRRSSVLRAIAFVESQLGEPIREDGPILGVEFDQLPPGAFGAPTSKKLRASLSAKKSIALGNPQVVHSQSAKHNQNTPSSSSTGCNCLRYLQQKYMLEEKEDATHQVLPTEPVKKKRSKFTKQQKEKMSSFAEKFGAYRR